MTARICPYLLVALLVFIGGPLCAEEGVTVISSSASTNAPAKKKPVAEDSTVVHKAVHKKQTTAKASETPVSTAPASQTAAVAPSTPPAKSQVTTPPAPAKPTATATASPAKTQLAPTSPAKNQVTATAPAKTTPIATTTEPAKPVATPPKPAPTVAVAPAPVPAKPFVAATPVPASSPSSPSVETGLPVARYPGMGAPIRGVSTYTPIPMPVAAGTPPHQSYLAGAIPVSVIPLTTTAASTYSNPPRPTVPPSNFTFANYTRKVKNTYPWKTNIITTKFWIGEGSTPISSTTNIMSSWDEEWLSKNHGTDSPNNRNGYASGNHASTLNPFYVALPFNDLAFPDKSRRWLPAGWYRRPSDGKQVSACKDRWVEIKNSRGDICFAQWEDVGPLRYDHAEYVFGGERPIGLGDNHAGLDVSPAVADYLNIDDKHRLTSWRFVDEEDVRPGAWLKLDEQAVLYTAMHQLKNGKAKTSELPVQRASEPIDDTAADSNKKKVDASKG